MFSFPASISCFRMRHAHNTHAPSSTSSKYSMYIDWAPTGWFSGTIWNQSNKFPYSCFLFSFSKVPTIGINFSGTHTRLTGSPGSWAKTQGSININRTAAWRRIGRGWTGGGFSGIHLVSLGITIRKSKRMQSQQPPRCQLSKTANPSDGSPLTILSFIVIRSFHSLSVVHLSACCLLPCTT